jgi:hypothetical protein
MDLAQSSLKVVTFCQRLNGLYQMCQEVAAQQGAMFRPGSVVQDPFSFQMSAGGQAELPAARIVKGSIEVDIRPSEISMDGSGKYMAKLSVGRTMAGAGRLTSPSCWTDLDSAADRWYVGAVGDQSVPLEPNLIASWLQHSGPRPIW